MASPFRRLSDGPVITADDLEPGAPGVVLAFNPGVVRLGEQWLAACRADHGTAGDPHIVATSIVFARSDDGLAWRLDPRRPAIDRQTAIDLLQPLEPHRRLDDELWRIYDPRLHLVSDSQWPLLMSVAVDTTQGLRPALLGSHDGGRQWYALWFGLPDNRNVVVFPRRIGGAFVSLERPCNDYGGEAHGAGRYGIWSRRSPDLNHWGSARLVASPGLFGDEVTKIGPGAPPIDTIDGWLCIVHLVTSVADEARESRGWEDDWDKRYSLGALLLDRDDPSRVLARSVGPLLEPEADFERFGFRGDVVFPTAAVPVKRGGIEEVWVYYGAADTSIGVAAASVATVLETLVEVGD